MIANTYRTEDLPTWSDAKLKANIESAERELEAVDNWENAYFLYGLQREEERRKPTLLDSFYDDVEIHDVE